MSAYLVHPPLSCRTSPPQGGRSAGRALPGKKSRRRRWSRGCHDWISPLVGEMPGRAEGGKPQLQLPQDVSH
ncbi:hypothetical protein FCH38_05410 [Agrobacterium tumefaciens]|nr:hypothetical protein [Agrobacterium tumefaciens]